MISNEVLTAIKERRSTRKFKDEQISPEQLDTLLEAAIWAPSGSNSQSWLFTAITRKEVLLRLNELVKEGFERWTPDDDYPGKIAAKARSKDEGFNFYYEAPTLIIASNRPNYQNAMADCALALENIFLAAQSIGLATCYINQLFWLREDAPLREFLSALGVPKEHVICSSAAVGCACQVPPAPGRKSGTIRIV
jgi:nitroreductase